jgi:pimeloyl-ACP methyl ester carboxylesterase
MSAIVFGQEIVHYEVLGRGRPLLFLHGWVGSWRYWLTTMQAVSIGYRAYALDLWGFGDTSKVTQGYSLEAQVGMVEKFLEQLGILRIVLVGHGLGAVVGLRFASRHPEVVDRLMVAGYPMEMKQVNSRLRSDSPAALAEWLLGRGVSRSLTEPVQLDAPKADTKAIVASLSSLENEEKPDGWDTLKTPALFVYGDVDAAVQPPTDRHLAFLPEQSHVIYFERSGHFPMLDESSKFNRLLLDFLSLKSGDSPRQLQLKEEWKRRVR